MLLGLREEESQGNKVNLLRPITRAQNGENHVDFEQKSTFENYPR